MAHDPLISKRSEEGDMIQDFLMVKRLIGVTIKSLSNQDRSSHAVVDKEELFISCSTDLLQAVL